jgi:raffinose/stachyose/melibiose transport system substrate-binding protein
MALTDGMTGRFSRRAVLTLGGMLGSAALLAACGGAASPTAAPAKVEPTKPAAEPTKPAAATTAPAAATTAPAATAAPAAKPAEATKPAATTAPAAQPAPAGGQKTVTYWVEFTDKPALDVITQYINGPFEAKFPQYKIQMTPTPDYQRQLQTAAAAAALPDIFNQFGPAYGAPLFDGGHLMPLDDLAKQYGWTQKIWPWMLDACRYQGKLISLPTAFETLHLFYNTNLFQKEGWQVPTNWTELNTLTKAQMDKKLIPFALGTSDAIQRHEWWLSYALNAYAGNAALYDALSGAKPWTDEIYVGAIDYLNRLWQSGAIMSKQTAAISHADALAVWGKQEAVMIMDGTWRVRTVDNFAKEFKWEIAKLPVWRDGVKQIYPIGCGEILCVNSKAKVVDGAAEYANWYIQDPKEIGKWVDKLPGIFAPPIQLKREDFAPGSNPILVNLYLDIIKASNDNDFGFLLWSSWPARTDKTMYENIDAVFLGQMTPKAYMEKVNAVFQEELKAGGVPQPPKPRP